MSLWILSSMVLWIRGISLDWLARWLAFVYEPTWWGDGVSASSSNRVCSVFIIECRPSSRSEADTTALAVAAADGKIEGFECKASSTVAKGD